MVAARHLVLESWRGINTIGQAVCSPFTEQETVHLQVQTSEKRGSGVVYNRPEDQFYHQHSSWSFLFPTSNRPTRKDELQPLRIVMWLKAAAARAAR